MAIMKLLVGCLGIVLATTGCQTAQQNGIPNPFLSADRVPAPPTRLPPQGTALPYYQNDALPQVPGGAQFQQVQPLPPSADITPIPADNGFAQVQTANVNLASAEPVVRIPGDEQSIRFAARPLAAASQVASQPEQEVVQVALAPVPTANTPTTPFREPLATAQPLAQPQSAPRVRLPATQFAEPIAAPNVIQTTSFQTQPTTLPPAGFVPTMAVGEDARQAAPTFSQPTGTDGFRPRRSALEFSRNTQSAEQPARMFVTPG